MQADPCFAHHQDGDLGDPAPPITRQVKVNGRLSEPIVLERGVAQGCPLSCLLFVLTVEIFHQMVRDDPLLPGIRLPQLPTSHHRHPGPRPPQARAVSSGFADDSALYVENMGPQWDRCKIHIRAYCQMSGAKLNMDKTVGLPMGTAASAPPPPPDPEANIKWLHPGEGERYLGARVGVELEADLDAFWLSNDAKKLGLLPKMRNTARPWSDRHLSYTGRVLVGRTSISSLLWYFHTTMGTELSKLSMVAQVMWQFLWGAPITDSTDASAWPRIPPGQATAALPKSRGGLNAQDVIRQARAVNAAWVSRLLSAGTAEWAVFGWHYICKVGRAHNLRDRVLYHPTRQVRAAAKSADIPKFWRAALESWWDLGVTPSPITPDAALCPTEAAAEPLRYSSRFKMDCVLGAKAESMACSRVQDLWDYRRDRWKAAAAYLCPNFTQRGPTRRQLAAYAGNLPHEFSEALRGGRPYLRLSVGDVVTSSSLESDTAELDSITCGYHLCGVVTAVLGGGHTVRVQQAYHQGWGSRVDNVPGATTLDLPSIDACQLCITRSNPKGGGEQRSPAEGRCSQTPT